MITTVTLNPSVDKTIYISKLLPNDANRIVRAEVDAGGKGINCARMLHELGVPARAIAFLGGRTGEFVKVVLQSEGVPVDAITTEKPTRICIAVEESGDLAPTTFNELGGPIHHRELVELFEKLKDAARESNYVVFGGSVPVGVNPDIYYVLIQIAANAGAKAVLDSDGAPLAEGLKAKPFMIKPNLEEAERFFGREFESKGDVARAALEFASMGIELVVISLGKRGAIACHNGVIFDLTAPEVKSVSTIGSGDSMIAGILCGLTNEVPMEEALRLGVAAGAATAMSSGSDIGRSVDVENLLGGVKVTRVTPA